MAEKSYDVACKKLINRACEVREKLNEMTKTSSDSFRMSANSDGKSYTVSVTHNGFDEYFDITEKEVFNRYLHSNAQLSQVIEDLLLEKLAMQIERKI